MKTLSMMAAVPLTVVAYNITMKMDSRNIDSLINALVIAVIILAVIIPTGLYVVAYLRDRNRLYGGDEAPAPRRQRMMPAPTGWGYGPQPGNWNSAPPMLTAQPTQPVGSFAVQQPMMHDFVQEDWT